MSKLFTSTEFIGWLRSCVGQPYWYGTYFNKCTNELLSRKAKQYPGHYTSGRMSRYRDDIAKGKIAGDCVGGAIKGAAWSMLGKHAPKYASNGVPDTSADGMFAHCKNNGAAWGGIASIPERPGIAVRFAGHVGVYLGNGEVFEWRGFAYGAVITKLNSRPWTHWYELPWVDDKRADVPAPAPSGSVLGSRLLKRGADGEDVAALQSILIYTLGYDLGAYGAKGDGVDGDYGSKTVDGVKAFQRTQRLVVDGEYGSKSHTALMAVLAERAAQDGQTAEEAIEPPRMVVFSGGNSYIRAGASTAHDILGVGRKGLRLRLVATAANGWHAVEYDGGSGWVSGKYTTVE